MDEEIEGSVKTYNKLKKKKAFLEERISIEKKYIVDEKAALYKYRIKKSKKIINDLKTKLTEKTTLLLRHKKLSKGQVDFLAEALELEPARLSLKIGDLLIRPDYIMGDQEKPCTYNTSSQLKLDKTKVEKVRGNIEKLNQLRDELNKKPSENRDIFVREIERMVNVYQAKIEDYQLNSPKVSNSVIPKLAASLLSKENNEINFPIQIDIEDSKDIEEEKEPRKDSPIQKPKAAPVRLEANLIEPVHIEAQEVDEKKEDLVRLKTSFEGQFIENKNFENHCFEGVSFKGATLKNVNLSGANLERTNFEGAILKNVFLDKADLRGANFKKAELKKNTSMKRANLQSAIFKDTDTTIKILSNANLRGAVFSGNTLVKFKGKYFSKIGFRNSIWHDLELKNRTPFDLHWIDLDYVTLSGETLQGLEGKHFRPFGSRNGLRLSETTFKDLNLKNIDLTKAYLSGVTLSGETLQGLSKNELKNITTKADYFKDLNLKNLDLEKLKMKVCITFSGETLQGLSGEELEKINFKTPYFRDLNLSGLDLSKINFASVRIERGVLDRLRPNELEKMNLKGARLDHGSVIDVNLSKIKIKGAFCYDLDFMGADLRGVDLRYVKLVEWGYKNANLEGAILYKGDLKNFRNPVNVSSAIFKDRDWNYYAGGVR